MLERLTERDEYGNADIIGVESADLQLNLEFDEFNKVTNALNRLAAYEDSGLSLDEVQELAKAKADGRLVVLPCKVGENCFVAIHTEKRVLEITVNEFSYSTWHGAWLITSTNKCQYWLDNAYCTREAAEKAIAEVSE